MSPETVYSLLAQVFEIHYGFEEAVVKRYSDVTGEAKFDVEEAPEHSYFPYRNRYSITYISPYEIPGVYISTVGFVFGYLVSVFRKENQWVVMDKQMLNPTYYHFSTAIAAAQKAIEVALERKI